MMGSMLGLGIIVGIILTLLIENGPIKIVYWLKNVVSDWEEKYSKKVKKFVVIILYCFWILYGCFFVGYLIDHFWSYWITLDSNHQSLEGLKQALLSAPGIVALITTGAFLSLVGALTFVLRIPFVSWEQIKIFGFEYKRQIKEVTTEANNVYDQMIEEHLVRYSLFRSMLEEEFYDGLKASSSDNLQYAALKKVVDLLKDLYKNEPLGVNIDTGVAIVEGNDHVKNLNAVPVDIQPYIQRCVSDKTIEKVDRNGKYLRAVPIHFSEQNDPYYIVYLVSDEFEFNEFDESLVLIAHQIVELQLSYMFYDRNQVS